jgi:hypothetical protein
VYHRVSGLITRSNSIALKLKTRLCCLPLAEQKGALETNELTLLIFVQDHAINHHGVAGTGVVNSDGNSHFNPCSYDVFIQHLTTARHVSNGFAETIMPRPAGFFQHDGAARSELRDRPAGVRRGRGGGSL